MEIINVRAVIKTELRTGSSVEIDLFSTENAMPSRDRYPRILTVREVGAVYRALTLDSVGGKRR